MRRADSGFTLLEVLVAFIIAALALGVMADGIFTGLNAAQEASRTGRALTLARSRLTAAQVALANGIVAPESTGEEAGGYRWHVRLAPQGSAALSSAGPVQQGGHDSGPRAVLYDITVTVGWKGAHGHARQVRLDGAQLALAAGVPGS